MKSHARGWTVEEFDAWAAATDRSETVAKAAHEGRDSRLSLVPSIERGELR